MNSSELMADLDLMLKRSILLTMTEVLRGLRELKDDPAAKEAIGKVEEAAALLSGLRHPMASAEDVQNEVTL